jgi:predicted nucleotidyltransferase
MKLTSFEKVVGALNKAKVRYLVVGGLAVNAHGYARFTNDIDLVIRLEEKDIFAAFKALKKLGYNPLTPITVEEFADPKARKNLSKTKNMMVLQMWSDRHPQTPVDIFMTEPFDFDSEYRMALIQTISSGPRVRFVSLKTLIKLKTRANRAEDKVDIKYLKAILRLDDTK